MPIPVIVLRPGQAAAHLNTSISQLARLARDPDFPKKIRLGARAVGYLQADLDRWLESRKQA